PVGLVAFDTIIRASLPPRSKRTQLGSMLAALCHLNPAGETDGPHCLPHLPTQTRGETPALVFNRLPTAPPPVLGSLHRLRHRGHEIILFHILDEAEVHFPFEGMIEFEDVEDHDKLTLDARGMRTDYLQAVGEFQSFYRAECAKANIDYVA